MNTKLCGKCREVKPVSEFGKLKRMWDGLHCHCKQCVNLYNLSWRQNLPADRFAERNAKLIAGSKRHYARIKQDPEKYAAYLKHHAQWKKRYRINSASRTVSNQ